MAELSEMNGLETYEPQRIEDLTHRDKKSTWITNTYFWERADQEDGHNKIKGCSVIVDSKQRTYDGYEKSDESSLTVITDGIFLIGVIEANEHWAMSTIDIGNAFI